MTTTFSLDAIERDPPNAPFVPAPNLWEEDRPCVLKLIAAPLGVASVVLRVWPYEMRTIFAANGLPEQTMAGWRRLSDDIALVTCVLNNPSPVCGRAGVSSFLYQEPLPAGQAMSFYPKTIKQTTRSIGGIEIAEDVPVAIQAEPIGTLGTPALYFTLAHTTVAGGYTFEVV